MHWDFALILVILAVAVPVLGRRRVRQLIALPDTTRADRLSIYASTIVFQWLAAGVILWRSAAHGIRPSQLGLQFSPANFTITITVVVSLLLLLNQIISLRKIVLRPSELGGAVPQLALKLFPRDSVERLAFFALVATVSVCEELVYRGFALRVFEDWSHSAILGILFCSILFSLAHLYQGRRGLISTFTVGLLFAGIRTWTESLVPSTAAHFTADLTVGLLAPARIRTALAAGEGVGASSIESGQSHAK
ncbi:MAG: CPBP family intramembrane glutamic endopeptidase [Candidatus Acidiferrales bacterium]